MLTRTDDIKKINSVLKHDFIWPRISDSGTDKSVYMPPMSNNVHYLHSDGILFILHPAGDMWQIHANVTPESREHADAAAKEALRYGFEGLGIKVIFAAIPTKYPEVYHFAKKYLADVGIVDGEHLLKLEATKWAL
jgi:hypothetical protein